MIAEGQVGIQVLNDGANQTLRMTKLAGLVIQELHGRFYEQNYRGNLFTYGVTKNALVATNAVSTLGATAQMIIGLYNPIGSAVNLVILQASIVMTTIPASSVSPAGFMWVYGIGQAGITTGANPISCKTLQSPGGSFAKAFSVSTPLTGGTGTNVVNILRNSSIQAPNAAGNATAVTLMQGSSIENIDGSLIVPPGAVLGIMCGTSTAANSPSVNTGILWEEVPI